MKKNFFVFPLCCCLLIACTPVATVETFNTNESMSVTESKENTSNTTYDSDFEPQILVENDKLSISIDSIDMNGEFGPELVVSIDNKYPHSIIVLGSKGYINGQYVDLFRGVEIPANATGEARIYNTGYAMSYCQVMGMTHYTFDLSVSNADSDAQETLLTESISFGFDYNTVSKKISPKMNSFEKQTLFENDNLKIIASSIHINDSYGPELNIQMTNTSAEELTLLPYMCSVNGYMADYYYKHTKLNPGETKECSVLIYTNNFGYAGISSIDTLDFVFQSTSKNNGVQNIPFKLILNAPPSDIQENVLSEATNLYEEESYKISLLETNLKQNITESNAILCIENFSDATLRFSTEEIFINNDLIDNYRCIRILPNQKAIIEIVLPNTRIPVNSISEFEFRFNVYDDANNTFINSTDMLSIQF